MFYPIHLGGTMPDISLPFEIINVAFNGIPVIAFIFALIQILKSFAPDDTSPQVWRGLAVVLGIIGCLVWQFRESGPPVEPVAWVSALITGVVFGFLAMRLYDQTLTDTERTLLKKTLRGRHSTMKVIDLNGLNREQAEARIQEVLKEFTIQSATNPSTNGAFFVQADNGGKTPV
jgi:hypothetical protein